MVEDKKKEKKGWKEALLQSSLPLEYSVTEILRGLKFEDAAEYKYERPNENNQLVTFSVDIHGTRILNKKRISLEFFIECKYRHPSTQWIFLPHSFSAPGSAKFSDTFIGLDALCPNVSLNKKKLDSSGISDFACGKGIEVYEDAKTNPSTITQAIRQLQYSLVQRASSCFRDQLDVWLGDPDRVYVLLPIIVTTAELWRMKAGTTLGQIRSAKAMDDVAVNIEYALVHERPDNQLEAYTMAHLRKSFSADDVKLAASVLDRKKRGPQSFDHLVRTYAHTYPSVFLVINYDAVESRLGKVVSFFDRIDLVSNLGKVVPT